MPVSAAAASGAMMIIKLMMISIHVIMLISTMRLLPRS
jgi:hypothetical protein